MNQYSETEKIFALQLIKKMEIEKGSIQYKLKYYHFIGYLFYKIRDLDELGSCYFPRI